MERVTATTFNVVLEKRMMNVDSAELFGVLPGKKGDRGEVRAEDFRCHVVQKGGQDQKSK